ncbi:MAG: NADH-quinone oxidoreductase subunit N [Planctomycetes bacterium]|nr:NADH-quinone oxidoreductase subunit N [Planctomycetota bacterium]
MNVSQLTELLPVGVVLISALVVVFLDLILSPKERYILPMAAMAGCLLALGVLGQNYLSAVQLYKSAPPWFAGFAPQSAGGYKTAILGGAFVIDGFGMAISAVALIAGALSVLCSTHNDEDSALSKGEFYGLVLLAVSGMMLLAFSHDFLTLLISLEIMSVATYILAGSERDDVRSGESALKYLVLGAFSTAFLMLGMAFIYGSTGSFSLSPVILHSSDPRNYLVIGGFGLLVVGILFKVGAAPFHFWVPDVYQGAPTGVTALMAVGVKAAAFAMVGRLLFETFRAPGFREHWTGLVAAVAVLTMAVGNLIALRQSSVKRLLAYSGIAHSGYLLLGFLINRRADPAVMEESLHAVAFYLLAYGVMTLGAFGVVSLTREDGRSLENLEDYNGLAKEHPALALCMAVFMLSLAGLPPFSGFFAKFMIFSSAIDQGFILPAVLGILTSVASLYYYLRVVLRMYMPEADSASASCKYAWTSNLLVYGAGIGSVLLGIFPHWGIGMH